jgi:hypothetical protein
MNAGNRQQKGKGHNVPPRTSAPVPISCFLILTFIYNFRMLPQQPVANSPIPKLFLDWSCSIACGESFKPGSQ